MLCLGRAGIRNVVYGVSLPARPLAGLGRKREGVMKKPEYIPAFVKKIKAAAKAKPEAVFTNVDDFMRWLTDKTPPKKR